MTIHPETSAFAPKWRTVPTRLSVLAVVHNVTSATRMLDVLPTLESDPRVQTVITWTESSPFRHGVPAFLHGTGRIFLPWEKSLEREYDLAITTSLGGDLHRIRARILRLPHGMGYNKYLRAENRSARASLSPRPETAPPQASRPVFGLAPEWLLHEGELIPAAIVLSHAEQADRLAMHCPEAIPAALVAGDPCYDRLLASRHHRARHRRALGLRPDQKLVLVSSTWGARSLFGQHPRLAQRLLGQLPVDEFRVALALHPNIWHGHGPGQVNAWIADARRSGLIVIPPDEGWRATLVASDVVFGDLGSVSYYSAALDRPVVLDQSGADSVAPDSPVARLLATAVAYDPAVPAATLISRAEQNRTATSRVAENWVSSAPGRSLELVRAAMYRLMDAVEPEAPAPVISVPPPVPEAPRTHPALHVSLTVGDGTVHVRRLPAAVADRHLVRDGSEGFLMVWDDEPDQRLSSNADLVVCPSDDLPEEEGAWARRIFRYSAARTAAHYGRDGCVVHTRDGERLEFTVAKAEGDPPADLLPALVHHGLAFTTLNARISSAEFGLRVRAGAEYALTVTAEQRTYPM